jgi:hypothetical protein
MALYPLNFLDDSSEDYYILDGVLLAERIAGDSCILLYDLGGFYIEVYCSIDKAEILKLAFFKETSFLEPYLEQISNQEFDRLLP